MGKKNKHSQDKLHKTVTELKSHHQGPNRELELSAIHRRLRFDSCCLTLNSVSEKPIGLCDDDGFCYVFEREAILEFLEKYQVHPVTGKKVSASDMFELKFHRNTDNEYHCPIIYKLFNHNSKIVTNRRSGHVYSYDAYQKLNLKPGFLRDLLTDEPFEKSDILFIQDPDRVEEKWKVSNFYYVKENIKLKEDDNSSKIRNIQESSVLKSSLEEYRKNADRIAEEFNRLTGQDVLTKEESAKLDRINSAVYSDGRLSRSVTSTVMPVANSQTSAILNDEEILYPRVKKKGYVQLVTNHGPLNLELFCDRTPKTCHNFLLLASRGYYDDTCFHRLIKNFIIQGGDPTGTGRGGESAWKMPFKDECHGDLKHNCRGVLAMANSGPGTNKSQFYITLKGVWDHLDGKHTIFGRVVGGDATLNRIEAVEVDKKDRPKEEIKILRVTKYVDPFEEAQSAIDEERRHLAEAELAKKGKTTRRIADQIPAGSKKFRSGVGLYVDLDRLHKPTLASDNTEKVEPDQGEGTENNRIGLSVKLACVSAGNKSQPVSESPAENKSRSSGDFSNW